MLQFFRKFFNSTVGIYSALALIGLLALAFVAGDTGNSLGGSITGGDRVASVGGAKISTAELAKQSQQALEIARQQQPGVTMKAFIAENGVTQVLDQMIDEQALKAFGAKHGVIAGKRLIDSELAKIPAFQGASGKFDEKAYRGALAQRQLNDADVRDSFANQLVARQLQAPAQYGASLPQGALLQYATLLKEQRSGVIAVLPSPAFAPKQAPGTPQIAAFYAAHRSAYLQPERRVIRYALFDDTTAKNIPAPTDSEIAARFAANKAQYAASESRKITQVIVISESLAKGLADEVAKGTSLEAAAKAKGLSAASLGVVSKSDLTIKSGGAVADAAFAAKSGALAGPAKSTLGYALVRVDAIETKAARTLDQVKTEITTALAAEKRRDALSKLTAKLDDEFGKGAGLSDSAKELGLTLAQTEEVTAQGQIFGKAGASVAPNIAPIVKAAFSLEHEGQAQISELVAGKSFVIFDVTKITAAAPAPLSAIQPRVVADMALEQGAVGAKAAALKILAGAKKGGDLAPLVAAIGAPVPTPKVVNMNRNEIAAMQGRIPPALSLFFGMAQGTTKLLPLAGNQGWVVVQLKQITPGAVDAKDPFLAQVAGELKPLAAREQAEALRRAIRAEVKVERNETAVKTVIGQLAGAN